jgi:glycosyltransferase involved in cell wall biosynthesis
MSLPVAFVVNGSPGSAMGVRARSLAAGLAPAFDVHLAYRGPDKGRAALSFLRFLHRRRPRAVYVFDMAASGVLAALAHKAVTGCPVVIDTGDAISALARSIGRGPVGLALTRALETASLHLADHLVVRGTNHRDLLARAGHTNVTVVQDGVDTDQFVPADGAAVRSRLGVNGDLVIGTLGSSAWNEQLQTCYGWEMLDVVHRLRDRAVHAVMIGDGSGIPRMQDRARTLGIADRVHFLGRVAYDALPGPLNAMDVCLSKQTNDVVGQVRTTGKLPLYMACGRYVLATEVGEAAHVLPPAMLVPFDGTDDPRYADRLTERVAGLLNDPDALALGRCNREQAVATFDYRILSRRVAGVLDRLL